MKRKILLRGLPISIALILIGVLVPIFLLSVPQTTDEYISNKYGLRVEMQGLEKIAVDGTIGIQVLARAWSANEQVGFGKDGSVEWEVFRIFNPPLLVDDPDGDIVRKWTDDLTGEVHQRRLREDPVEAIRQTIAHNITIVGKDGKNIQPGKIGSTTTTVFPDADPESTTVDGELRRANVNETFADIRAGVGNEAGPSVVFMGVNIRASTTTGRYAEMRRPIVLFDTSVIADGDTIDSATLSFHNSEGNTSNGLSGQGSANSAVVLVSSNPASNTDLVGTDYSRLGNTEFGRSVQQDALLAGYNNITLNDSGIAHISKTGVSKFGLKYGWDFENTETGLTWSSGGDQSVAMHTADQSRTDRDPKLVVEHSSQSPATPTATATPTPIPTATPPPTQTPTPTVTSSPTATPTQTSTPTPKPNVFPSTGNVGIGTENPEHELSVDGTIKSKEVIVSELGWADYVFEEDYILMPISELEEFIQEHGRLPGIPSAQEVEEHGINLGATQAQLLAKIEELTLYLIEQQKEIELLKSQLGQD